MANEKSGDEEFEIEETEELLAITDKFAVLEVDEDKNTGFDPYNRSIGDTTWLTNGGGL